MDFSTTFPDHDVILCGDWNVRVGEEQDMEGDNYNFEQSSLQFARDWVNWEPRRSRDKICNKNGKKLIELCKDLNFVLLNGRGEGDSEGELTFVSELGSSVVDYAIVSGGLYKNCVRNFQVDNRTESHHFPICFDYLYCSHRVADIIEEEPKERLSKYKWRDKFNDEFNVRLSDWTSQAYLINANSFIQEEEVDKAMENILDMFYHAGASMKVRGGNFKPRVNNWFDKDCESAKLKMRNYLRQFRITRNQQDLEKYLQTRRDFKDMCCRKQRERDEREVEKIEAALT